MSVRQFYGLRERWEAEFHIGSLYEVVAPLAPMQERVFWLGTCHASRFLRLGSYWRRVWVRQCPHLGLSVMKAFHVVFCVLLGCSSEQAGPMLHELSDFAGAVEIKAPGQTEAWSVGLSFSRATAYFSCQVKEGVRDITLLGTPGGSFEVYEDTAVRPASQSETQQFGLISDLINPRVMEAVESGPEDYRVRRKGVWYSLRLVPVPVGVHGSVGSGK